MEKTPESPLDSKGIKSVKPIGNKPYTFIERTDTEVEAPILWPLDGKNLFIGKDHDLRKTEGRRRGQQRVRWLDGITDSLDMNLSTFQEIMKDKKTRCDAVHGINKIWT